MNRCLETTTRMPEPVCDHAMQHRRCAPREPPPWRLVLPMPLALCCCCCCTRARNASASSKARKASFGCSCVTAGSKASKHAAQMSNECAAAHAVQWYTMPTTGDWRHASHVTWRCSADGLPRSSAIHERSVGSSRAMTFAPSGSCSTRNSRGALACRIAWSLSRYQSKSAVPASGGGWFCRCHEQSVAMPRKR